MSRSHVFYPRKVSEKIQYALTKKEKKSFLNYKEIEMGSGAKSYMRKGFLIYEEAISHI
jgi:hypothetical protein